MDSKQTTAQFRLTYEEKCTLKRLAKVSGLTESEYIRNQIFNPDKLHINPKAKMISAYQGEIYKLLIKIERANPEQAQQITNALKAYVLEITKQLGV
jgi:hypothetical protein